MNLPLTPSGWRRVLSSLILVGLCATAPLSHAAPDPGFKSIFNGKDLTGWEGNLAFWSVKDGCITGQTTAANPLKSNTFLVWKGGEVKNFELRAVFRLVPNNDRNFANSGIQYRSRIVDAANFVVAGYQADMDGEGKYVGMIYEEKGRTFLARPGERVRITSVDGKPKMEVLGMTAPASEVAAANKPREWNEYRIVADGNHLQQFINGKPTAEVTDLDTAHAAKSGVLALQIHVGQPMTVQYKTIELKTLP